NKKVEDLLELLAVMQRRSQSRPLRLIVAGAYQKASSYFRLVQEKAEPLGKSVRFLGAVTQHELCACYRAAHLFVSMSEHEGFGLPLVEAMAAGVPVVAFDAGSVREALGGAGALFTPKSYEHVAALCEILLDDPVRRRRVIDAQRLRAAKLSPEAAVAPLSAALEAILGRPSHPRRARLKASEDERPRVAFVVPRYGTDVVGGAERHCRTVAQRMSGRWRTEILTSCAQDYLTWANDLPPGTSSDGPVTVRRFAATRTRDMRNLNAFSRRLFGRAQERLIEEVWVTEQGPDCPGLLRHLSEQRDAYDGFVFFTYLYAPTVFGLPIAGRRALFVPTAHDEAPLRFGLYRQAFASPAAILFNTPEEQALCEGLFEMPGVHREVVGIGVEARTGDPGALRARLGLRGDYLLYLGRIAEGKGLRELLVGYALLRRRLGALAPALILAGPDEMRIGDRPGVHLTGALGEAEKWDALAGAALVVVPSAVESLSLLALEAWGAGKAVLANGESPVLTGQTRRSEAGVTYRGAGDLAEQAQLLLGDPARRRRLGDAGRAYVAEHYRWERIEARYAALLEEQVLGRPGRVPARACREARPLEAEDGRAV
ncbi:MAG TPA: glycosyltransferase, partial [Myxococcales bacterium]|nr:glycosyltransferase [Myxococcales bacterium]